MNRLVKKKAFENEGMQNLHSYLSNSLRQTRKKNHFLKQSPFVEVISVYRMMDFVSFWLETVCSSPYSIDAHFENIVEKGEIARNEQFLLFPQCFLLNQTIVSPFVHIFDIISLFATEFEKPKIGISGKGLRKGHLLHFLQCFRKSSS